MGAKNINLRQFEIIVTLNLTTKQTIGGFISQLSILLECVYFNTMLTVAFPAF